MNPKILFALMGSLLALVLWPESNSDTNAPPVAGKTRTIVRTRTIIKRAPAKKKAKVKSNEQADPA